MAVVVAERVRRLAADFRSAVALVRAALRPAGCLQCRDQPARLRCRDLRLSVPRRGGDHPVVPRARLACRRRARGCDGIRARRLGQCAHPAHRAGRPPRLWLVARALEHSSWRAGLAAGAVGGLMAIGRDQVALLSLYVLAGFVLAHWVAGEAPLARVRASIKPLAAAAVSGSFIAAVPVILTTLLAARSYRAEISFAAAAGGSIHPVHLLQFAFADLFGAMDPNVEYWAPQSPIWDAAWGWPGLYLSQNMPLVYAGALTFVAVVSFGLIRGV